MYKADSGKLIIGEVRPPQAANPSPQTNSHETILKARGRAYRWKCRLESGEFSSINDLAKAEKINHSYVRRILRLALLSPDVTEAILDYGLSKGVQLEQLLRAPGAWIEQANLPR